MVAVIYLGWNKQYLFRAATIVTMRFIRSNDSGLRKVDQLRIKIRYYRDGGMETQCQHKEGQKWKNVAMMFGGRRPSWDELHGFLYVGRGEKCRQAPQPIDALIRHMQFTEHCFGIDDDRKSRRQKKGSLMGRQ